MLKYFEITNAEEEHTGKYDETKTEIVLLHVYMDERDLRDKEWHGLKPNGFTEARTIHDFPLRELKVVLHVRRRRWLAGDGGNVILNRIPLAAVAELKRQEREFKKRLAQNQKRRENYRKKHPKNYKGKVRGPKPMRKNTRFTAPKIELEVKGKKVYETKVELLTHVRYPLMKSRDKWTERQKAEMEVLFKQEPRIETAYNLVHRLRCLFKSKITPEEAKPKLDEWCKDVGKSLIRELISVRDTIRQKETEILYYFINRSTNASAESLNSKIKGFRTQLRGIQDLPFFMYRLRVLFG